MVGLRFERADILMDVNVNRLLVSSDLGAGGEWVEEGCDDSH